MGLNDNVEGMVIIGWVSLSELGTPHRKQRSGYRFYTDAQKGKHPARMYSTENRAARESPINEAAPVYMKEVI